MQKEKHASPSTNYRYKLANRTKDLSSFCQFRNEYENCISRQKIMNLKEIYQHGICGKTRSGNLVVVDKVGAVKMNQVNKVLDEEQIIRYFNQRMLQISEKLLEQREQVLWIIDLHGKIMQLASKKLLNTLTKIILNVQTYFPNILYKMYLVNTPMLFDTIWNKFCGQISEQTQQKFVILNDELDLLYEDVESSLIPEFLGGEMPDQLLNNGKDLTQHSEGNKDESAQKDKDESSQQENDFDFSSLKQALSSMKMGSLSSVNQTPLNTQADDNN